MKKTRRKHLFRTIRKNGVSFFAVGFIAAVSIAIFLGFQSTADAILKRADRYYRENCLENLEISCANGITQEDLEAIAGWDGVDAAEGGYTSMVIMDGADEKITLQALSLGEEINVPVVVEGTLPTAENEAAIEEKFAEEKGLQVGDEFTLQQNEGLYSDTFRVTAIINLPMFSCANVCDSRGKSTEGLGAASYYIGLSKAAFDTSYYDDCFSTVSVRNASMDAFYYYSDDYAELEAAFKEMAEELGEERAELRYASLKEEAEAEIADAREELEDAEQEISEKETELENALEEIEKQLTVLNVTTDLEEAKEQLEVFGETALPLKNAITEYQEGSAQLEEAKAELEESRAELAEAEEEAAEISFKEWMVSDRNEIGDVRGVRTLVDGIFGLSYSMSIIFLLVAIIVCHAAIKRMIEEQRALVGAQKALGFRPGEILKHYLLYNTLSAFVGILIGYAASVGIVEVIVLYIYAPEFLLGKIPFAFAWKEALISAGICLVVFLTATYAACAKLVREPATVLLRGEVPEQGKKFFFENWKCYRRLNLYSRTMIKNVLNDKGRMMTTIMGVVGCISLLLICFSLKLAIANSSVWQFDRYFLYENRLVFDSSLGSAEEFETILEEEGISYTLIQDKLEHFRVDGGNWENGRIVAVDDAEELKEFMVLEDGKTKEILEVPEDGLLVSRRAAEEFGLTEGSTVEVLDAEGNVKEFRVAGMIEHYLPYHLFVTSASYFEETMGEAQDACVFLLKGDIDGLLEKVRDVDGFLSLKDNSEFTANSDVIDPVIGICLLLAAVMAVLVLLNQIVMHMNRKARELAVMRINGYTLKETRAYIYKDNIVLTVLGLILGSVFGMGLSYVVIRAVETGAIHYVRTPSLPACLYACGVGAVFALIVNLIALRKIKHLNLTNVSGN
ncbi:MAG: ABC transporter permease [Eubacteriales bacterium]|nr:ABC transporter permease [Eubacteriales bacterium]